MARKLQAPWSEVRIAGRVVAVVEFGEYPPAITTRRAYLLTPAQREEATWLLTREFEAHGYPLTNNEAYARLFGR